MSVKKYYYSDELNDDFVGNDKKNYVVDSGYVYNKKSFWWKLSSFLLYRIIVTPFAYLYMKIKFSQKIVNRKLLRRFKSTGYFLYSNHTMLAGDAFIPSLVNFPNKTYVVVGAKNISNKFFRPMIEMCGAIPLPSTLSATKNFLQIIDKRITEKSAVFIYPEAHIWPYYTDIRPFKSVAFRYPITNDVPTFVVTNTFKKRKFTKVPKVVTYIDGPFYCEKEGGLKEKMINLRNEVYETMVARSKLSDFSVYTYIKREETKDD